MLPKLKSYIAGVWQEGTGDGAVLVNPATEEPLACATTVGLDLLKALAYARGVGGPALRELTFAQRAACLEAASKVLQEHREELLQLACENGGNTRGDGKFDVDGATGTLAYYARLGRNLGDGRTLRVGEAEPLGRSPRYVGAHRLVSRPGVAVHINAFNFPAWGLAEKAATAWLAGMPVVTKPATSTAMLAVRMTELLLDANVLPQGALQIVSGGVGDMLDHLGWQDVLAFTGSSATARQLRQHPRLVTEQVRVNIEADSVNAALLGPDVEVESELYSIFIRDVVREMTQKTGQKCTAVRRILVPRNRIDAVRADLTEALTSVVYGNPADARVKMGPITSQRQLQSVQGGIDRLGTVATLACGGVRGTPQGVEDGQGFFVAPTRFVADGLQADAVVHSEEVFGPVATLLPYDGSAAEVATCVGWGGGALMTAMYSDDLRFVQQVFDCAAAHQGRLYVASAKVAEKVLGPGAVLPALQHGGPGRAGGGAELAGQRGLELYMHCVALQGYAPWLERL